MWHCKRFQKTFKNGETENVNEMFASGQPYQDATVRRRFREWLQGVADGLVELQLISDVRYQPWFYPATSNNLKMETESVHETSAKCYILTWLSVPEGFIHFCGRKSFKTERKFDCKLLFILFKKHFEGWLQSREFLRWNIGSFGLHFTVLIFGISLIL